MAPLPHGPKPLSPRSGMGHFGGDGRWGGGDDDIQTHNEGLCIHISLRRGEDWRGGGNYTMVSPRAMI